VPEIAKSRALDRLVLRGSGPFVIELPMRPLRSAAIEGGNALWLGPDEWLILAGEGDGAGIAARLAAGMAPMSLVDVSHRDVGFDIAGGDAATLLNGAVPLDLTPGAFPPGMCTRTLCEKAEVVLWRRAAADWHIEVARSLAGYVCDLLAVISQAEGIQLTLTLTVDG
jgi:sarcosine oxidase subunit gamma